jgi:hypothetical protein
MKPKKGDKILWKGTFTKKLYDCIITSVRIQEKVVRVVKDPDGKNPLPYIYYWIDFDEIIVK